MKEDLKSKSHIVRGYTLKEELERLAIEHEVELSYELEEVEEGWCRKPKGLLQVLWERGWINKENVSKYSLKGNEFQKDSDGKILPEHRRFILRSLMA